MKKVFKYLENLWIGMDGRPSLRSVLAIVFSIHFIRNVSFAIRRWDDHKSLADFALVMGIEAGLICTLLGLKAYTNLQQSILDSKNGKVDHDGPNE